MIKSMTGYGRAQGSFSGGEITAEIKSVNNRYLDCGIKLPRGYAYLEEGIKSQAISARRPFGITPVRKRQREI